MARWLIVNSIHHASQGGVGGYVDRIVRAAAAHGWEIELLTRPSDRLPPAHRVHLVETVDMAPEFEERITPLRRLELIRPYRYGLWSLAAARHLAQSPDLEHRYDAIEFMDCWAEGVVSIMSRRVRDRFQGTPMLIGAHTPMWIEEELNGADPSRFGRRVYHAWEREAIKRADGAFSPSRAVLEHLPTRRKGILAYPMILPDPAPPLTNAHKDEPKILVAATLQPRKGVIEWIESLNVVLAEHPRARAWLVGPDTPSGPEGASMQRDLAARLMPNVRERVQLLGRIDPDRLAALMREAALIVVPSRFECFSLVASDAMGFGRPTLLSDAVGAAALAPSARTFPAGDRQALAVAQIEILEDLDGATERAAVARTELAAACDPAAVLERRAAFAAACRQAPLDLDRRPATAPPASTGLDAIDAIDAFDLLIRGIERAERTLVSV